MSAKGKPSGLTQFVKYVTVGGGVITVIFKVGERVIYILQGSEHVGVIEAIAAGVLIAGVGWVSRKAIKRHAK